jgi:hypothetical protein
MNKREIPLAFISFTWAIESLSYGNNNLGCWPLISAVYSLTKYSEWLLL